MALSNGQITELIKNPPSKAQLIRAQKHEQRVRFHAEESTEEGDCSPYLKDFRAWVSGLLPKDKAAFFFKVMGFPVYTNELIKGIAEEYAKVYESQNSSFTYEFSNETQEADFKAFLRDSDFWSKWKDESAEAMMTNINSIVIVDMPSEPSEDPNPYHYFQSIEGVHDISVDSDGKILYLITKQDANTYLVIDETRYAMFVDEKGIYRETLSSTHTLGYCPASFFWKEAIIKKVPICKRSPLNSALTNLNWLLYFETARRCHEISGSFPILSTYKEKCTYYEEFEGQQYPCESGFIHINGSVTECRACSARRFLGPGTLLEAPLPTTKEQFDGLNSVVVVSPDDVSLKYNTERSTELWDEIFYDCVGFGGDDDNSQAKNKTQVRAGFESKLNILIGLKENLEVSHKFIIETKARLKYGNSFKSCTINYGTDFYLKSSSEAVTEYKEAKLAGVPQYFINHRRNQIDSITTKGNELDQERLNTLKHLEPWIDMSLNDAKALALDVSNREQFLLKADFSRLILKFETEYGSIVEFGSLIEFKTKIDRIYKQLIAYVKEEYPKPKEVAPTGGNGNTVN